MLDPACKIIPLLVIFSHYLPELLHVYGNFAKHKKCPDGLWILQMIMYKNGSSQGIAYEDVFEGVYYPAVSLYKNAKVGFNKGNCTLHFQCL